MKSKETLRQDKLEQLIIDRLGERKRKLDRMQKWERNRPVSIGRKWATGVAACITIAIVMAPFVVPTSSPLDELGIEYSATVFRAASEEAEEIDRLIESGQYGEALTYVDKLIEENEGHIGQTEVPTEKAEADERDYEIGMYRVQISELRWVRIYLLTRMEQYKEAEKELHIYLQDKKHGEHSRDAELLKKALKEKDKNLLKIWVTFYKIRL